MLVARTTSDSFPNESQELAKASEKLAKNATSMYIILSFSLLRCFVMNINILNCLHLYNLIWFTRLRYLVF